MQGCNKAPQVIVVVVFAYELLDSYNHKKYYKYLANVLVELINKGF